MAKKRAKGLVMGLFVLVMMVSFSGSVLALCPQGNADLMLRLSSQSNAHGEVYNGANNYATEICYSNLFGNTLPGSYAGSEHNCDTTNTLVWLSGSTNAHAATTTDSSVYVTEVCYGDLTCNWVNTGSCALGEVHVLSLSTPTNAHLEDAAGPITNYLPSSSLPNAQQLCCSKQSAPSLLRWQDGAGVEYVGTVYISDFSSPPTIRAVYVGNDGTPDSTFDISEDDGGAGDDVIYSNQAGQDSTPSGDWEFDWTADSGFSYAQLEAARDEAAEISGLPLNFYFSIDSQTSPALSLRYCGDNLVQSGQGEQCDDGNNVTGDGCDSSCQNEAGGLCGNGVLDAGETCDCSIGSSQTPHGECDTFTTNQAGEPASCSGQPTCAAYCIDDGASQICQVVPARNDNDVYFTNLLGTKITQAYVGDTVRLLFPGGTGETSSFSIYDKDVILDDHITPTNPVIIVDDGTDYMGYWEISQADWDAVAPDAWPADPQPEFGFDVGSKSVISPGDLLEVFDQNDPANSNAALTARITSPVCGQVLTIPSSQAQVTIPIDIEVNDADDLITWTLDVDSTTYSSSDAGQCGSSNPCGGGTFNIPAHSFTSDGVKRLELRAQSHRGGQMIQEALAVSNVLVIDKNSPIDQTFVAACIDEPLNHIVTASQVRVHAASTRAVTQPSGGSAETLHEVEDGDISLSWDYGMSGATFSNPYPQTDSRTWDHQVYYKEPGMHTLSLTARYNP